MTYLESIWEAANRQDERGGFRQSVADLAQQDRRTTSAKVLDDVLGVLAGAKWDDDYELRRNEIKAIFERLQAPGSDIPVRVKRLSPDAKLPQYAHDGDAGADLFANESVTIEPGETAVISTGLAVEIPPDFEWQIRPRSGLTVRTKLRVQLGTIDSTYRGEVGIIVDNTAPWDRRHIRKGDKVAQGVIAPVIHGTFTEVDALDETERGQGGFGSTGVTEVFRDPNKHMHG
jgi:dUTP pyrophosphatase